MSVPLPAFFGKYQLLSHIAEGGMADVYLGRLLGPGGFEKRLVVKVIRPELAQRREFCEMFVAEAKITVSLTHANIVPVYELGMVEGQYYLAMELVDGPTVHQLVFHPERGGPVPPPLAVYIVEQVLRGLDYAHRKGVIHRDLSSANVMCSRDGEVKIVDFGIASHFNAQLPVRMKGGSAGYMPPEQQRGEDMDARGDIYAAGVLFAEVLTGRRFSQLPRGEARCAPPYHVPPPLAQIIETATHEDPEARYPDAAAMLLPLSRYLREEDPPTQVDLSRLVRRRAPDERRLSRGTPARLLALLTHAEPRSEVRPEGPLTRPLVRRRLTGEVPSTAAVPGEVAAPRSQAEPPGRGDATPALPRPLRPTGEIARVAGPPAEPVAGEEVQAAAPGPTPPLPPPGGTVTFASRPARTHATWRTYLGALLLVAIVIGLGAAAQVRSRARTLPPPLPATPAAPPRTGALHVTLPPGATLLVDGQPQTPGALLHVPPGQHQVAAQAPGRRPMELTVEVRAGETLRERLLLPWIVGSLRVESTPEASVSLNGEPVGETPLNLDVPLDRVASLRLTAKGHAPLQREVLPSHWVAASPAARLGEAAGEADDGQPEMRLQLQLEPLGRGALTVGAVPWAQVFVDGERRGDTPLRRLPLAAGSHSLRLYCPTPSCPAPRELRESITVEPGREVRRVVDFRSEPPEVKE